MRPEAQPTTPAAVLDLIDDGADLIVPLANGEPVSVLDAIEAHAERFQGREVPRLLRATTKCSLVLAAAAPMDRHGYFSMGTNCDCAAPFIGHVPFFLEVNAQMPRTFGREPGAFQSGRGLDRGRPPLVEIAPRDRDEDRAIAGFVAERVPNGATLQVGVGSIPSALLAGLRDHRDLAVEARRFGYL